jgi:hypothetical protein
MKNKNNVKDTVNEFMIDILGCMVPGVIFLMSIIISIIIPVIMIHIWYHEKISKEDITMPNFNEWSWLVLFFTFLILAYAIGNLFYRLDIKEVDRISFRHQRKKHYKELKKQIFILEKSDFCDEYRNLLSYHLSEEDRKCVNNKNIKELESLLFCENVVRKYNNDDDRKMELLNHLACKLLDNNKNNSLINGALCDGLVMKDLRSRMKNFIYDIYFPKRLKFLQKFIMKLGIIQIKVEDTEWLAHRLYAMFSLRSEIACDDEDGCQFPYEYYDTYLIKRKEEYLMQYATWCINKDTRSKNALNKLKLEISDIAPKNQSIIIRNEAHIRMSSSTFFVAKYMRYIITGVLGILIVIPLILYKTGILHIDFRNPKYIIGAILLLMFPIFVLICNIFIRRLIIKFLHYQRLREIFFVLQIYYALKNT